MVVNLFQDETLYPNHVKIIRKVPVTVEMRTLSGVITDRLGNPVPNATIQIKRKSSGVTTDANGRFTIKIDKNDTIKIGMAGFTNIELDPNIHELNENGFKILSQQTVVNSQQMVEKEAEVSVFPVPYPTPSASYTLESAGLKKAAFFYQIDSIIKSGLDKCAYDERKYFYIPGGFALITQMEQIENNGVPLPAPDRWSTKIVTDFNSPMDYIKALFSTTKGFYRVFVFLYTNADLKSDNQTIDETEARAWFSTGYQNLPNELKYKAAATDYNCSLLVYHFEKQPGTKGKLIEQSPLSGKNHFIVSKLADTIK